MVSARIHSADITKFFKQSIIRYINSPRYSVRPSLSSIICLKYLVTSIYIFELLLNFTNHDSQSHTNASEISRFPISVRIIKYLSYPISCKRFKKLIYLLTTGK